jgi:hypothetical protein
MGTEQMRSDEEKRQAGVFAARFSYQSQRFMLGGEEWQGDVMGPLPKGVEPELTPQYRLELWRRVLPASWSDAQVAQYQFKHWCGGQTLDWLHCAGLALGVHWIDGLGYCEPQRLARVKIPSPCDIAHYTGNQHYALVEQVHHTSTGVFVDTIDGNQGRSLAKPSIKMHKGRRLESAYCYYSIDKFLREAST